MNFKYTIYDHDIGGAIHEDDGFTTKNLDKLFEIVNDDLLAYSFEADICFDVAEAAFIKELERWNPDHAIESLKSFRFANGFTSWHCKLPGGHRELVVELIN